ncbi:MAG: hypothetical protein J6I61_02960, partial [Prevotella sp.]|nr:hypothetical protein [Prevotella sp.]
MKKLLIVIAVLLCQYSMVFAQKHLRDSVELKNVTVIGKSKTQKLREGALSVNAIDVRSMVNSLTNLNSLVDKTAGVKVREEGGV